MTDILTCHRCGLADASVITRDNSIPHHVTPMKCIAALKVNVVALTRIRAGLAALERTIYQHDLMTLMDNDDGSQIALMHGDEVYSEFPTVEEILEDLRVSMAAADRIISGRFPSEALSARIAEADAIDATIGAHP